MAVFGAIISTLIGGLIFFGILYYVVAAAVKKGILESNFVTAITMGIRDADKEREVATNRTDESGDESKQ